MPDDSSTDNDSAQADDTNPSSDETSASKESTDNESNEALSAQSEANADPIVVEGDSVIVQGNTTTSAIAAAIQNLSSEVNTLLFKNRITVTTDAAEVLNKSTLLKYVKAEAGANVYFAPNTGSTEANLTGFFDGCSGLESIDGLSSWDVSSVERFWRMFKNCSNLSSLTPLSSWVTTKLQTIGYMCEGCTSLTTLDGLSTWNVSTVPDLSGAFMVCSNLTSIDAISTWNVSNGQSLAFLFYGCNKIASLDAVTFRVTATMNFPAPESGTYWWPVKGGLTTGLSTVADLVTYTTDASYRTQYGTKWVRTTKNPVMGDFLVTGDNSKVVDQYATMGRIEIQGGSPIISMAPNKTQTTQHIYGNLAEDTTITLNGIHIERPEVSCLINHSYNCKIILADDTTNIMKATGGNYGALLWSRTQVAGDLSKLLTITTPEGGKGNGVLDVEGAASGGGITEAPSLEFANLLIESGTIIAQGGPDGGAGIGSASPAGASNIRITGGNVKATGGPGGAGIGGGAYGNATNISITGGTVEATGGTNAPGIGAGYGGITDTVSISGGAVVTAQSTTASTPGIGSGTSASKVSISGNSVVIGNKNYSGTAGTDFSQATITNSVVFTKASSSGSYEGALYGNVTLSRDVTFPATLRYATDATGVAQTLTIDGGATLTLQANLYIGIKGIFTLSQESNLQGLNNANVQTYVAYDIPSYAPQVDATYVQAYTSAGAAAQYGNALPTSTAVPGLKAWYATKSDAGAFSNQITSTSNVLPNQHTVYAEVEAPFVVKSSDGKTLTFVYGTEPSGSEGVNWWSIAATYTGSPAWRSDTVTKVVIDPSFSAYKPTSTAYWFSSLSYLTSLDGLSNVDTRSITDMRAMFYYCSRLTSLTLSSNFTTGSVENMQAMFQGCEQLTSLTLPSTFATDAVKNMSYMFANCSKLATLTLPSTFNTASVENMSYMLDGCTALTSFTLPAAFNTGSVQNMSYMFRNCAALDALVLPDAFNTGSVVDMTSMFESCKELTSLTLSNSFNTSSTQSINSMFYDCSSLASLALPDGFVTSSVSDTDYLFGECTALTALTLPKTFTMKAGMELPDFYSSTSGYWITSMKNAVSDFDDEDDSVAAVNAILTDLPADGTQMFTKVGLRLTYDANEGSFGKDEQQQDITTAYLYGNENDVIIKTGTGAFDNTPIPVRAGYNCLGYDTSSTATTPNTPTKFPAASTTYYAVWGQSAYVAKSTDGKTLTFSYGAQPAGTESTNWWEIAASYDAAPGWSSSTVTKVTIDQSFWSYKPDSTAYWFSQLSGMTTIEGLTYLDTSASISMNRMFYGCSGLSELKLPETFKTSAVKNMYYMFNACADLATLELPAAFDTKEVTTMYGMFAGCSELTELELPDAFDTGKVNIMAYMFSNCRKLESLKFPDAFTTRSGTTLAYMFYYCEKLTSLDLTNFTTNNAALMASMFASCSSLTSLTLSKTFTMVSGTGLRGLANATTGFWITGITSELTYNKSEANSVTAIQTALTALPEGSSLEIKIANVVVTFNSNGGAFTTSEDGADTNADQTKLIYGNSGESGVSANAPTASLTGYTSDGWSTTKDGAKVTLPTNFPQSSTTYYVRWTAIDYSVTLDAGTGTSWGTSYSKTITATATPSAPVQYPSGVTEPTKSGYTFSGWKTTDGATLTIGTTTFEEATGKTYLAQWTAIDYTVVLQAGEGTSWGTSSSKTITASATPSAPVQYPSGVTEPTKSGYTFSGWKTTDGATLTIGTTTFEEATGKTYLAQWTAINYSVTLDAGSGTSWGTSSSKTITATATPTAPVQYPSGVSEPTRPGYTFADWKASDGSTLTIGATTFAEAHNKTYTAIWTASTITNTFNANTHGSFSGDATTTVSTTYGNKLNLPAAGALTPVEGYVFVGWFTAASGGTQVDSSTDCPATATTYYAHYDIILTFSAGEGSWTGGTTTQTVQNTPGTTIKLPATEPTRVGYTFTGYGNPAVAPEEPDTYIAGWSANTISNIFSANGHGSFSEQATATVDTTYGNKLNLPAAGALTPADGYVFTGWYTQAAGGTQVDTTTDCPATATTYYAHYDIILTFDAGEGSWAGGVTTQTVQNTPDTTIKLPATEPTRVGYTFTGYGNPTLAPDEPKTYTAIWSAIDYSVTLNAGDNTSWGSASTKTLTASATPDAAVTYPEDVQEPTKSGYTFSGWKTEDGTTLTIGTTTYAEATGKTFVAQWTAIDYTVVLQAGEGTSWGTDATKTLIATATPEATVSYPEGVTEPAKSGYTFSGWKTEDGSTLTIGTTTYAQATGKTYLAQWTAIQYSTTLNAGESTSWGDPSSQTIVATATPDAVVTYPIGVSEPTRTGYTFEGWKSVEGDTLAIGTTTFAEANGNVYLAQWEANTYTNTFNANGHGAFSGDATITVDTTYDTKLNLPAADALTPDAGYVFVGWFTEATGGTQVTDQTDCPAADTTYYAHWDIILTFKGGGGVWADGETTKTVQNTPKTQIKLPETNPTRAGYVFEGYENPAVAPDAPATYTAGWDAVDYVVTLDAGEGSSWGNTHTRQLSASGAPDAIVEWTDAVEEPTRTGYTLDSWKTADGSLLVLGTTTFAEATGKTYTATWRANTYTNTFSANGHGTFTDGATQVSIDTTFDTTLNLPAADALTPEDGYVFIGWYTLEAGGDLVTADTLCPAENTTYYAHWDVMIGFDANGGEFPTGGSYQSIQNTPEEPLRIPGLAPVRAGYTFEGWKDLPETTPVSPTSYTATWSAITYTVTLNAGENTSWESAATKTLTASATPAAAVAYPEGVTEPTKLGYSFKGWKAEDASTLTIGTTTFAEADGKTYSAEWEANTYTNTFSANGHGTFAAGATQVSIDTTFDTKLNLPEVDALTPDTDYVFLGWFTEATGGDQVTDQTDCPAENTTYFAHYDILLTFSANGGTFSDTTTTKQVQNTPGATIALPSEEPTRGGYTFKGYNNPDTVPLAPATYNAQWEANTYTNTFSANGHGSFGESATQTTVETIFGNKLNLPAPDALTPEEGYVFTGWFTEAEGGTEVTDQTDCPAADTTYYAHWDIILTFSSGEGAWEGGVTSKEVQNTPGTPIVLPAENPTRVGYTFKGYNNPDTAPEAPLTYTAQWEANTYTNTFSANGHGTFATGATQVLIDTTFDTKLNLPEAGALTPETGYVFLGWFTEATGGTQVTDQTDCPAENTTYYAHYNIILTFEAAGGAWEDGDTTKQVQNVPGANIQLPETNPVRRGYIFSGYNSPATAPEAPDTYSATWDAIEYAFTLEAGGDTSWGSESTKTITAFGTPDAPVSYPSGTTEPERAGYSFKGWRATDGTSLTIGATTFSEATGKTYSAIWEANTISNTFAANGHGSFAGGATEKTVTTVFGNTLNLPAADALTPDAGYAFLGWFTDPVAGEEVTEDTSCPATDTTYYAHWEALAAWATIENGTLKLFWGQKPAGNLTFALAGPYSEQNPAPWQAYAQDIQTLQIDASLKESPFAPGSYASYMENLTSLNKVEGISNLNMQNATSLERMFCGCSNLEVVDLSGFNTEHITNMDNMFLGCTTADKLVLSKHTQLLPGTGLAGLDSSTNPFWIASITHALTYDTDDLTSVANINSLLAELPEGATQTLRLATMRLTYEANGGTFPAQSANTQAKSAGGNGSAAGNASAVEDGTAEEAYLYGNPGEEIDESATGGPNYTPIPVRAGYEYLGYAETPDATTPDTPVVFPEATSNLLSALSGAGDANTTFYAIWKAVGPGPTPPTPDTDGGSSDIFPLTGDTTNALASYILCILAGGVALAVARVVRCRRSR